MQEFLINDRYLIHPELNQVQDRVLPTTTRLEPRVMQVLTMLCKRRGQVVTREELSRDVWNDYGGADEALTQSISFLRKLLGDSSKEIIKTIPKKGYVLQASITSPDSPKTQPSISTSKRRSRFLYPAVIVASLLIAATLFGWYQNRTSPSTNPQSALEVPFPRDTADKNSDPFTTITTTDSSGNRYRLVIVGDRLPKFYVNDTLHADHEPYNDLIDRLSQELWKRRRE